MRGDRQGEKGEGEGHDRLQSHLPGRETQHESREDESEGRTGGFRRSMHAAEEVGEPPHAEARDQREKSATKEEEGRENVSHDPCARDGRG